MLFIRRKRQRATVPAAVKEPKETPFDRRQRLRREQELRNFWDYDGTAQPEIDI